MGWGDEIMATAQARRMQLRDPRPVQVVDRWGGVRWHPIWDNNPRIRHPEALPLPGSVQKLFNAPGHRPYLNYNKFKNRDKDQAYVYTDFRVEPGEIYLTDPEKALGRRAAGAIILEPNIKASASPNKDWGWIRWSRLAWELRNVRRLVQIGAPGSPVLGGVEFLPTADVRQACGVLSGAALLISPEGGLHHAAAALGIRAVVIFGGFISPATTGYEGHVNFFAGGKACGMRVPCAHCREAMERISPQEVAAVARRLLGSQEIAA